METRRKKIFFIITKSNFGGAQHYVYDLAKNLSPDTYDVSVALGGTGRKGDAPGVLKKYLESTGIRVHVITHFVRDISLFSEMRAYFELIELFKKERPDIVHLNSSKAILLGALAGRIARVPKIVGTIHGWPFYEKHRGILFIIIAYLGSLVSAFLLHDIIVVSKHDHVRARMPRFITKKIHIVRNGIENTHPVSKKEARQYLIPKVPLETTLIGSVGELTGNKNTAGAIRACALLREAGYHFHYAVIGSGEEKAHLQSLIEELDLASHVTLCGFISHTDQYLSAFDIFLMPSYKEGLPYVLLEAGLASLPVVASNAGGIPEIIQDKNYGLLVTQNNPENISEALKTLLDNKETATAYGNALHAYVTTHFSLARMLKETENIY